MNYRVLTVISLVLNFPLQTLMAETPMEEWQFSSRFDSYKIEFKNGQYTLDGEAVDMAPWREFIPLFSKEPVGDCGGLKDPDLTVKGKAAGQVITRQFFIKERVFSDKGLCGQVSGEGVYYLPLHRVWFTGSKNLSLSLGQKFTLKVDELELTFENRDGQFALSNPDYFVDWDFFDHFFSSLKNFNIHARLHPDASANHRSFSIKTGQSEYIFYLVGDNFWAVKLPGIKWLVASKDWARLRDMNESLLKDRHFDILRTVVDTKLERAKRSEALTSLGSHWSKSIESALHSIILNPAEDIELKTQVASMMKLRPSDHNFTVLVRAMTATENLGLLNHISKILRVRNPKGPVISEEANPDEVAAAIRIWKGWAIQNLRP